MNASRTPPPDAATVEPGNQRLDSWKEIAAYFRRDESTVRRWEKDGLPVHRHRHKSKATVFAYRAELDVWWRNEPARLDVAVTPQPVSPGRLRRAALVASAVLTCVLVMMAVFLFRRSPGSSAIGAVTLFMSSQGELSYPAFSPDGSQLAFAWVDPEYAGLQLYSKSITSEAPLRLTDNKDAENFAPVWSPDGTQIAFLRRAASEAGIFAISAKGGAERKLLSLRPDRYYGLDWSPDGQYIAFAQRESADDPYCVFLLSLQDGRLRQVTFPPKQTFGELRFAFSPNGKSLAFVRHGGKTKPLVSVGTVPLAAIDKTQTISSYVEWVGSLAWSPDGRSVVLSGNVHGIRKLWRVYLDDHHEEPLSDAGESVYYPAIARNGNRLAFVREIEDADLWRVDLSPAHVAFSAPVRVNFSTRVEGAPRFSPDGNRIAFMSYRSGLPELWVSDPDGNNAVQVTAFGISGPELPSWSPDGQTLVFAGGGPFQLVRATGGQPRQLPGGVASITYPSWSRDGNSIYFCRSGQGGVAEIWKVPVAGGSATLIVKTGISSLESPDGKLLYFTKGGVQGIWSMPVSGGKETLVVDRQRPDFPGYWSVVGDGIYFLNVDAKAQPTIEFFDFSTRKTTPVLTLSGLPDPWRGGLTVTPNGRSLIFSQQQYSSYELVVAENFK